MAHKAPTSSLRVRRVHALQVQRPYIHSALLDLERELPANLVVVTLLAYLSTIGWLIGDHMTRARVPTRAKVFAVAYLSTVGVFWYARQAFLEHAAGAARPVQCRDTLVWDNIDLQMEVFEK